VTLEGRTVRLEPLEPRHEEPLWAAAQDERVWRYMRIRGDASRAVFDAWFESALAEIPFAVVVRGGNLPVPRESPSTGPLSRTGDFVAGSTSYMNIRPADRVVEIGNTWLAAGAWGTGANDEAKLLLMEHAFEHEGFLRVEFKTEAANERSRGALLAVGATFEGIFRKHMVVRGGERRDSAWYSVIDDDWPAVKAALEQRVARSVGRYSGVSTGRFRRTRG